MNNSSQHTNTLYRAFKCLQSGWCCIVQHILITQTDIKCIIKWKMKMLRPPIFASTLFIYGTQYLRRYSTHLSDALICGCWFRTDREIVCADISIYYAQEFNFNRAHNVYTEDEQLDVLSNQETCCVFGLRHLRRECTGKKEKLECVTTDPFVFVCFVVYW